MNRETIRWLLVFIALTGVFYWVDQTQWFNDLILDGLTHINAGTMIWVLSFLGVHLERIGTTIITGSGYIEIARSCTGSFVFMMFAAAVLPFPSTWNWRLKGLFFGLVALLVLNLFRTSMIVLVGARFPNAIAAFHIIIGQVIVIAGMAALFLWWAKSAQQGSRLSFFKKNRQIFRAISLFCVGYLCGSWLYQAFLKSTVGLFVKQAVARHTSWLINVLNNAFLDGHLSHISLSPVKLIEGCLSSPMVVVFAAVVFAWPARWWKRAAIVILGFLPFFYGYHLFRAVLIAMTLGVRAEEGNFVYNFYGQILLAIALFAGSAYLWCTRQKSISYKRFASIFLPSVLIGAAVAVGLGWLTRHFMMPLLTDRISAKTVLAYDPEQSVSLMLDLLVFIWVSLVGSTPGLSWTRKCLVAFFGMWSALMVTVGAVSLIEVFHLAPHKGVFKLSVILLPFAVYYFLFHYREHSPGGGKGKPSATPMP